MPRPTPSQCCDRYGARQRNPRGETDEVFDGYGLLSGTDVGRLADGELSDA